MKRLLSLVLAMSFCLALLPSAALAAVTPTPPDWIPAEDYMIFPGDSVYDPKN